MAVWMHSRLHSRILLRVQGPLHFFNVHTIWKVQELQSQCSNAVVLYFSHDWGYKIIENTSVFVFQFQFKFVFVSMQLSLTFCTLTCAAAQVSGNQCHYFRLKLNIYTWFKVC